MPSSTVIQQHHWNTIEFYYKIEVVKLFHKGYNGCQPEVLSKRICAKRLCSYSLCARNNLKVPRFNTSIMNNSLIYQGTVLWNLVNDKEECSHLSLKGLLERISNKYYFKDFSFKAVLVRHEQSDFVYY